MTGEKLHNHIRYYLRLSKLRIMLPVSLTGFTGYFLFKPVIDFGILLVSLGVFLVAVSASVLNQLQETDIDIRMNRTRNRPLPAKQITSAGAMIFFALCFLSGMMLLYFAGNFSAAVLALFAVGWYNGVYTGLKKVTAFAVIPGALTGAIPPLIGWVAAGGNVLDKTALSLSVLFFIGQIPHFWLLMLKYDKEYRNAGIPTLTGLLPRKKVNILIFGFVIFSALAALSLCYFEIISSQYLNAALIMISVLLIWQFTGLIRNIVDADTTGKYSRLLDVYYLLILLLLISDRLMSQA
ncbi:MAG TPA: protoheme IX farnesyltransferase [Bacteroidales bacterium]|nr:protoheme IX farnesyltransferase [Bacteroidales bacterium]